MVFTIRKEFKIRTSSFLVFVKFVHITAAIIIIVSKENSIQYVKQQRAAGPKIPADVCN